MERLDLDWCGEVVGYLAVPRFDGDQISGRWLPAKSDLTEPFLQFVCRRYARPWKKPERVDFIWDGEQKVADVVFLMNREIWIRLRKCRISVSK